MRYLVTYQIDQQIKTKVIECDETTITDAMTSGGIPINRIDRESTDTGYMAIAELENPLYDRHYDITSGNN